MSDAEDSVVAVAQSDEDSLLNVFVHSTTGDANPWTDAEVECLLLAWKSVLEGQHSGPTLKLYDAVRRVTGRLLREEDGLERLRTIKDRGEAREEVRRLMKLLRKEYTVYKGMQTIDGLRPVRHPCVDHLEQIIDVIPATRRAQLHKDGHEMAPPNNKFAPRRRRAQSEGPPATPKGTEVLKEHEERDNEEGSAPVKPRYQQRPRMNLTRLVRVMVAQQQTMLEQLERLFKVLEVTSNPPAVAKETSETG